MSDTIPEERGGRPVSEPMENASVGQHEGGVTFIPMAEVVAEVARLHRAIALVAQQRGVTLRGEQAERLRAIGEAESELARRLEDESLETPGRPEEAEGDENREESGSDRWVQSAAMSGVEAVEQRLEGVRTTAPEAVPEELARAGRRLTELVERLVESYPNEDGEGAKVLSSMLTLERAVDKRIAAILGVEAQV